MSRQQRRALERQQAKQNRKTAASTAAPVTTAQDFGHSTGPRTPEGKAISSQNALHHGLTSTRLVLPWESQADFDHLLNGLVSEHRPATTTEEIMVREMAEHYWRLMRARNQEYRLLAKAPEILKDDSNPELEEAWDKNVTLTQRYITRSERSFHKCLSLLRTLQKERRASEAEAKAEEEETRAAEVAQIAAATTAIPGQFVSQNELPLVDTTQITAAVANLIAEKAA